MCPSSAYVNILARVMKKNFKKSKWTRHFAPDFLRGVKISRRGIASVSLITQKCRRFVRRHCFENTR